MTEIRTLTTAERPAFVTLMAQAFRHDPLFLAAFGDPDHQTASGAFMSFMFDMTRLMGGHPSGIFVEGQLMGCILLEPPASNKLLASIRMILSALRFLPVAIRLPTGSSAFLNTYMTQTRAAAPATPHSYLTMIGVHPEGQGRGFGQQLMVDAIAQGTPIALNTENMANVALYERWGFSLTSSVDLGHVTAHCMFRPKDDAP